MEKEIELDNGNILALKITESYAGNFVRICELCMEDNCVKSEYILSIKDDIEFCAYVDDLKATTTEFELDINHPLYFCFNRFLGDDDEFIVDDDRTFGKLEKYVTFKREGKLFKIIFVNNTSEKKNHDNQFGAFIKNILEDMRSKIIDYETKLRIINFLREAEIVLKEDFHQITFDEYMEVLEQAQDMDSVFKLKKSKYLY